MDNEALVDQIVRSLSFEVVAVPQTVVQIDSTSKSTPLNVKIRVRKKHDAGFRHGVLSMPKVDTKKNSSKDNVPERVRLVSSDQTIMSFNVLMEADFDKVPPKHRKENMNLVSSGLGIKSKNQCSHMDTDFVLAPPVISKRNKDIFGRCKPGGCLDPPYGEEKYSYKPKHQNLSLPVKDDSTKLRSSSIFKNKIFKRKKKNSQDDDLNENDMKRTTEEDSIICSNETASLQSPTVYSNSIITYPHPSNSGELFLQEDKNSSRKRFSSDEKSRSSVIEDAGSYFVLPKKKKKQPTHSTMNKERQNNGNTRDSYLNNEQINNNLNKPEFNNIPRTLTECSLSDNLKNKQFPSKIDEIKITSKDPIFIPIALLVPLNDDKGNNNKDKMDNLKRSSLSVMKTMPIKNEADVETKSYSQTKLLAVCDDGNNVTSARNKLFQANASDKFSPEECFSNSDSPLPEIKKLNYTNDVIDFPCTAEKSEHSEDQRNHSLTHKYDAFWNKQKEIIPEDRKRPSIHSLNEKQRDISDPIVLKKLRNDKNSDAELNQAELYTNNQKSMSKSSTNYIKDDKHNPNLNLGDKTYIRSHSAESSKEKCNLDINTNIFKKVREVSRENVSETFKLCDNEENFPYSGAQANQKNIVAEHIQSFLINDLSKKEENISEPTILPKTQNNANGDTDINQTIPFLTNKNIPNTNKSRINNIIDEKSNSDVNSGDLMGSTSLLQVPTEEKLNLEITTNHSNQVTESLNQNISDVPTLSENEKYCDIVSWSTSQDMQKNNFSKDGIKLENGETDISQARLPKTNHSFITETKSNISNIITDRNTSNIFDKDQINIKSNPPIPKEQSILDTISDPSRPIKENAMQNSNDVLKLFENKEHIETIPYTKTQDMRQKYYSEDEKSLSMDSHKEMKRKGSELVTCQERQSSKKFETDQNHHPLVTTKNKSDLDIMHNLSTPVRSIQKVNDVFKLHENEKNIKTVPYSTDDLHHIWGNESEPLNSRADFITETTLPLIKSDVSKKYASNKLQLLSFETFSSNAESNQEQFENYLNPFEDAVKHRESSQSDLNASDGKKERVTQTLIKNIENTLLTHANFNDKTSPDIGYSEKSQGIFSEIDKTMNNSNVSSENRDDSQLTDLKNNVELSNKLSILTFESANPNFKKAEDFFEEQIKLHKKSSIDLQNADVIQRISIFDQSDINNKSFDSEEALKNTSPTRFTKDKMTTKYLIQNEANSSTQSIQDHKVSNYNRTATETLNNHKVQNVNSSLLNMNLPRTRDYQDNVGLVERNELTVKQSPYLVSDRVESELTKRFIDIDVAKNSSVRLDQLSPNEISKVSMKAQQPSAILPKRVVPWKFDIALQSYIDGNNEKILKSFDSKNMPERRVNDAILVAQCYLGTESNEIKIPINQETDLSVQIKRSKCPNPSIIDLNENASITVQAQCKKKFELDRPHQTDLDTTADLNDYEYVSKPEVNKFNKAISDDLRDALTTIYEQELLPLQDIIKGLREEIDILVAHQNKFKEKVQKLASKRTRPLRLVYPNKKCACIRRM